MRRATICNAILICDSVCLDPAPVVLRVQLTGTLPPYLSTLPVISEVR